MDNVYHNFEYIEIRFEAEYNECIDSFCSVIVKQMKENGIFVRDKEKRIYNESMRIYLDASFVSEESGCNLFSIDHFFIRNIDLNRYIITIFGSLFCFSRNSTSVTEHHFEHLLRVFDSINTLSKICTIENFQLYNSFELDDDDDVDDDEVPDCEVPLDWFSFPRDHGNPTRVFENVSINHEYLGFSYHNLEDVIKKYQWPIVKKGNSDNEDYCLVYYDKDNTKKEALFYNFPLHGGALRLSEDIKKLYEQIDYNDIVNFRKTILYPCLQAGNLFEKLGKPDLVFDDELTPKEDGVFYDIVNIFFYTNIFDKYVVMLREYKGGLVVPHFLPKCKHMIA